MQYVILILHTYVLLPSAGIVWNNISFSSNQHRGIFKVYQNMVIIKWDREQKREVAILQEPRGYTISISGIPLSFMRTCPPVTGVTYGGKYIFGADHVIHEGHKYAMSVSQKENELFLGKVEDKGAELNFLFYFCGALVIAFKGQSEFIFADSP